MSRHRRHAGSALSLSIAFGIVLVSAGCSSSSTSDTSSTTPTTPEGTTTTAPLEYATVVRGTLVGGGDMSKAKATHDQIAAGGEAASKAAGDFAHDALLGTTMLDSIKDEFLAIDRWKDAKAMEAFYADPKIQQAFGGLFSAPPTIEFYVAAPTWVNWGVMDSADGTTPHYVHLAIGVLKEIETPKNQKAHDQVAAGGKQPSLDAGNVAHVVFIGLHDERKFVTVDIWSKATNIEGFYTNPQFTAAFGALFESVKQPVYESTDWHQW